MRILVYFRIVTSLIVWTVAIFIRVDSCQIIPYLMTILRVSGFPAIYVYCIVFNNSLSHFFILIDGMDIVLNVKVGNLYGLRCVSVLWRSNGNLHAKVQEGATVGDALEKMEPALRIREEARIKTDGGRRVQFSDHLPAPAVTLEVSCGLLGGTRRELYSRRHHTVLECI